MNLKNLFRRALCVLLLLCMLVGILPPAAWKVQAQESTFLSDEEDSPSLKATQDSVTDLGEDESLVPTWPDIAGHYRIAVNPGASRNDIAYTYMSCMTIVNSHAYYIRTTEDRSKAIMLRSSLKSEATGDLQVDGKESVTTFGEAKALDAITINKQHYLFLATGLSGTNSIRLLHTPGGESITTKASFGVQTENGTPLVVDRLTILSSEGNNVTLLIRCDWNFYTVTIDVTSASSTLTASFAFGLNSTATTLMAKTVAGIPESYPVDTVGKVNLVGMDYDNDRLYVAVAVDCCSVVLVYSDVAELISSVTKAAEADSELCIRASGYGYDFYRIQDLDVENGVIYFNSRCRWITSKNYRGDICHFTNNTTSRYDILEGGRENGIYLLRGTQTPNMVMVNPKADDGHLNVVDISTLSDEDLRNAYFALESDRQGYWYIRSLSHGYDYAGVTDSALVSKYYITASEDGSISLAPKEEGNNRQLWYLRYTPSDLTTNKVFAIQNKSTGLYLNSAEENGIHKVLTTTGGKTYYLEQQKVCAQPTQTLEDLLFDYTFYTSVYPEAAGMTESQAKAHYNSTGKKAGYLPSPFFDPAYYLANNADVRSHNTYKTPEGAYSHFINYGFWEGRQGSEFFCVSEYYSREKSQDIRNLYSADKVLILYHFKNYGIQNNATIEQRAGSDEFDLKEFSEEIKLSFANTESYSILRDYVAGLVRLKNCTTQAELEALLFDPDVYSKDPSVSESAVANFAGNTYEEKLYTHWVNYGRKEGRTASMFFSAPYYTSRYPEEVQNLADAYNYFVTTGFWKGHIGSEYVAMGLDPENLCKHEQTATALLPSCTDVCKRVDFCASCKFVVHRETSPALPHTNENGDDSCDLCSNIITQDLLSQSALLGLPIPVPVNELVTDVSAFAHSSAVKPEGTYYMVQKNRDGIYRILNPLNQSNVGTIAATQVFDVDGKLMGADPDMAADIYFAPGTEGNTDKTNHYHFKIEDSYFLSHRGGSQPFISDQLIRKTSGTNLTVTPNISANTIAISRNITDINGSNTYYLCLDQRLGMEYFEWSYSKTNRESEDVFYLYRILEDQLHTEALYAALQNAVSFIPYSQLYETSVYSRFLSVVSEAKTLYERYNGLTLTGDTLAEKDSLQKILDKKERELLDLISILTINIEDDMGRTVKYFTANMFRWNEDSMNQLVADLDESETKGFFFENANNKDVPASAFSDYDDKTSEIINGVSTYAQMYSIYSGLAAPDLSTAKNPPFHNDNVVAADYWSTSEIEGAKEVFTDIRVPFIYDENGFYNLNSDKNGVFFEGEAASGSTLAILDKPMTYYWSSGPKYGVGVPGYYVNSPYGHRPANGYVTAFQPFAKATATVGKSYPASASNFSIAQDVDGYLMDGVALASGKAPSAEISGRGTPTWGFGMHLNIDFQMTQDGNLNGDSDQPITFSFSGDDDVWVYIDGMLVMELGGSHDAIQGEINFATGDVIVSSDKYDRIRDKNENGYGRGADAAQYGENITEVSSILTNQMYQKNIYNEVFEQNIEEFAAAGVHTLSVYYMDRGKGRTNCAISFNLPQSDTLVVEKEIPEYYGNEDGTQSNKAISEGTMAYLSTLDFGFTLKRNDAEVAFQNYSIFDADGVLIGTGATDRMGHFTLKNGWRAEFRNLQFNGQSYVVTEDPLNSRWSETQWSGSADTTSIPLTIGSTSPAAAVTGGQYESETITFHCTNTYTYDPVLIPEEQVVVMDYGKPIDIAVIDNAVFDGISDLVAREGVLKSITLRDATDSNYVSLKKNTDTNRSVRVTLKKMLDKSISLMCTVKITLDDGSVHDNLVIPVTVLPATIMYYETDFYSNSDAPIFSMEAKPVTQEDKYQWNTKESSGKDSIQDSGEVGDIVYKPVIDKESIPANAFFVDFDGEGYTERYSVDPLYGDYDFDGYQWTTHHVLEPELSEDGSKLIFPYDASYSIDQERGIFTLDVAHGYSCTSSDLTGTHAKMYGSEFYTAKNSGTFSPDVLQYIYTKNDYFQIRFKLEDCEFDPLATGATSPYVVLRIQYRNEDNGLEEQYVRVPYTFADDEYIVASGALPTTVKGLTIISFGVRFQHLRPKDNLTKGRVLVDYLYVGPDLGWKDSVNSDYLYFGFGNTPADQSRYCTVQYGTTQNRTVNFDAENTPYWAISHGVGIATIDNMEGTISYGVDATPTNPANCGPRFMTTGLQGTFPVSGSQPVAQTAILNYDLRNAEYIQIRFKVENCTWSPEDTKHQLIFLCNYLDKDGIEKYSDKIIAPYTVETEEYQTIRIPLTQDMSLKKDGVTLTAFGLRFRSIIGKDNADGAITIDELFIGSEESMKRLDQPQTGLFFDFNNGDDDKIRYNNRVYGGYNFDRAEEPQWAMSYGADKETNNDSAAKNNIFTMSNGTVSLEIPKAPHNNQTRIGTTAITGMYAWNTTIERMPLAFPSDYADYIQIRFKTENCQTMEGYSPNVGVILYYLDTNGEVAWAICDSESYSLSNEYQTLTFSTEDKINDGFTFLSLGIIFRYIEAAGTTPGIVTIDSLYIGEMVDSKPAADSIYIGFDDLEADRDRYASDTYGYVNPDEESPLHWWKNGDKVESMSIDNRKGVAEVTAVPELRLTDETGAPEWPDIYLESAAVASSYNSDYLDFKPQNAEIYQIRFKMENFDIGTTVTAEGQPQNVNPYVKLQWQASNTANAAITVDASERISLNKSDLTSGKWITITAKIPEENRNVHSIMGIRPYFGGLESLSPEQLGKLTIDYIYIGPDDRPDQVYGYDSHYNNDTTLSDGSSLFVEGSGVKLDDSTATYTEASFSFKGTGFDIISRTGSKQATIRVEVKNSKGELVKSMTVNNKGELELYQIPVVSVQGLTFGTYTVTFWVNKAVDSPYDFLSRGGEFYFDAVRIYDPMNRGTKTATGALSAYKADREAYNYIKEIRNILLSKDEFESLSDTVEGAVFVDVNSTKVDPETGNIIDPETGEVVPGSTEYTTADVQTYNKIGPKNEVYLAPGQAVAFNLQVSTNQLIASLDIGAKTIVSSSANMEIGILAMNENQEFTISTRSSYAVQGATAQYWALDLNNVQVKAADTGTYQPMYLVIYNASPGNSSTDPKTVAKNVISLTDVKVAYKGSPKGDIPEDSLDDPEVNKRNTPEEEIPVQFLVDGNTMVATRHFLRAVAETPILDENAKIRHSLNLASDIAINYIVAKAELEDYDSFYLECRIPVYEGNTYVGEKHVTLSPIDKGEYWYFTLDGLTAVHMMDEISARLIMNADGRSYYSETDLYSIAQYAMAQLNKSNTSASLKALCANLLRYGAKAQIFKGYRTNTLADRDMTEEQRALLTDLEAVAFGSNNKIETTLPNPKVTWAGKSLVLDSKVTVRYIVDLTDPTVSHEDLTIRVRYTDYNGVEKEAVLTEAQVYGNKENRYSFDFDRLLASELRTVLYATVYCGDSPVSDTLCYSADTYGANKTGALGTLCKALMAYSDMAKAFFA